MTRAASASARSKADESRGGGVARRFAGDARRRTLAAMRNQDFGDSVMPEVMRFAVLAFMLLLSSCVSYSIDYIDFVHANGITYVGEYTTGDYLGRALTDADLGAEQFRVKQSVATAGKGPGYQLSDGDAAFVDVGQPVYAVRGYAPTFR